MLKMLAGAGALTMAATAMPAMAQAVQVYTNQSLFDSQRPGITTNTFSFPKNIAGETPLSSPYTVSGVTFSATPLTGYNDNSFGQTTSYISTMDSYNTGRNSPSLSITFSGPVLGLTFGSVPSGGSGSNAFNYVVNGQAGSVTITQNYNDATSSYDTVFLGFDTGRANSSINVVFTGYTRELDIINFQTAVPEAATWAMMLLGVGAIGFAMRRRNVVTHVRFA